MPKLAEIQKFIIWVFGSITVFGCISTLIAYLIYDDKPTVDCKPNDTQCEQRNQNITATQRDNEILKIISPVAVAVGIVMIVIIRCWQQSAAENANEARREGGEANTAYQGTEFDMGAPPSYNDALGMDAVLEAHGSFPMEPPPKYDEILREQTIQSHRRNSIPDGTQDNANTAFEAEEVEELGEIDSQTLETAEDEESQDNISGNIPGDVNSPCGVENELDNSNRTISTVYYAEEQNSPSREIRIFVQQRDSNLSAVDLSDDNEQTEEIELRSNAQSSSSLSEQVHRTLGRSSSGGTAQHNDPVNENVDERIDNQSDTNVNSDLRDSMSHPNADLNRGSSVVFGHCSSSDVGLLNIRDSVPKCDSNIELSNQSNRLSSTTTNDSENSNARHSDPREVATVPGNTEYNGVFYV